MPAANGTALTGAGRLLVSLVVCGLGLVAVIPPQNAAMWRASVIITEWGHWLGLLGLLLLFGWGRSRLHAVAATFTVVGLVLMWTPLTRAVLLARTLPMALHGTFGAPILTPATYATSRPAPLVLNDLMLGMSAGDVLIDEHVYTVVEGENLTLDLYRPEYIADPRPVVVVIHGGAWTDGDKRDFTTLSRYLAARGYVVASVDYRLAPRWTFPSPQEDVLAAIRYIKDLETTHGVDPTRFALLGRSVGGQIALLAAYSSSDPAIRGVVSMYGPTALRWGYENPAKAAVIDSSGILELYLGGPPETHGAQYDAAEPGRFVSDASQPTLFIHGLRDEHVSPFHAEFVSSRLIDLGVPNLVVRMPWATHGCDYVFSGPCGQVSTYAVEQFLGAVLGNTAPRDLRPLPADAEPQAPALPSR